MNGDSELHSSKPNGAEHSREYFTKWIEGLEHLLEERDKRYEQRFNAQETAVSAAFVAQKELNRVVQDSAKEAVVKAENAQTEYNKRSNEFRGALDDQAKVMARTMILRVEYEGNHKALLERMEFGESKLAEKVEGVESKLAEKVEGVKRELALLHEARIAQEARTLEKTETHTESKWTTQMVFVVVGLLLSLFFSILSIFRP
jgi:ElaB/YqjD/DUF883 family membrane-anchored ribosome-binding protein